MSGAANDNAPRHRLVSWALKVPMTDWRDTLDQVIEDAIAHGHAERWSGGLEWDPYVAFETIDGGTSVYRTPATLDVHEEDGRDELGAD